MVNMDVLVVYSAGVALSASVPDSISLTPFSSSSPQVNYNLSYAYFLNYCKKLNLKAAFTTSSDVTGPGSCSHYWTLSGKSWVKHDQELHASHIFDKISPVSSTRAAERALLFSDDSTNPFNDQELFALFFDKFRSYKQLSQFCLPTVAIRSPALGDVKAAISRLELLKHQHSLVTDFGSSLVLKDRFGAGGNHVYQIKDDAVEKVYAIMKQNPNIKFVLQPFLPFEHGYAYNQRETATDIRLIYHHDELLQSYVRMAKTDDFRCNQHQGGDIAYVQADDIPDSVHLAARNIMDIIDKPNSLFTLDFIISNGGNVFFLEGNIGPGINWDINEKTDTYMAKQLIRSIVGELERRVRGSNIERQLRSDRDVVFDHGVLL
jgi:glutathione synthase/RimK-type ligase-like ATP-grasp enzyme